LRIIKEGITGKDLTTIRETKLEKQGIEVAGMGGGMGRVPIVIGLDSFRFELKNSNVRQRVTSRLNQMPLEGSGGIGAYSIDPSSWSYYPGTNSDKGTGKALDL